MSDSLTEAKHLLASNRTEKAARDFMTTEQRDALAENFASRKQFLSASHFTACADKRKEFEQIFWENINQKGNKTSVD